ncbi:MAG: hypothetical protein EOP84_35220 [Verrucomicrobiaceae bacterium]|nr:MAG: hypothetical protein EOP84_35220 [Verrucomicrobiaceae bacterium]
MSGPDVTGDCRVSIASPRLWVVPPRFTLLVSVESERLLERLSRLAREVPQLELEDRLDLVELLEGIEEREDREEL